MPDRTLIGRSSAVSLAEPLRSPDQATVVVAAVIAAAVGALFTVSLQSGRAALLVLAQCRVYFHSRRAGIALLLVMWLLVPGLRRALGLIEPVSQVDVLAVTSVAATSLIGIVELQRNGLGRPEDGWLGWPRSDSSWGPRELGPDVRRVDR